MNASLHRAAAGVAIVWAGFLVVHMAAAQDATVPLDTQAMALLRTMDEGAENTPVIEDDMEWVRAGREGYRAITSLSGEPVDLPSVRDIVIPAARDVTVRIYDPAPTAPAPGILYLHGGGFTAGGLDTHDAPLRRIARDAEAVVVAPDYALAPEVPFPGGLEDAEFAYLWLLENAGDLDVNPERVVVMGDSAGGNLAAALALRLRDSGLPPPAKQILLYPNTDLRLDRNHPSIERFDGFVIDRAGMDRNIGLYLPSANDQTDPLVSPLVARDLSSLPPAHIVTAGADPLRDEGEAYAERLRDAGIKVTHTRYPGMVHGFLQLGAALDATEALYAEIADAVSSVANPGVSE